MMNDIEKHFIKSFPNGYQQLGAWQAVEKMRSRFGVERGGYEDGALGGLNITRLLEAVWLEVSRINENSTYNLFVETLSDIGSTCPEGDSHRLLILLNSLVELA